MKTLEIKKGDKIHIISNGNQAPYGIGETMEIIPAYHIRKVRAYLSRYYNAPALRLNGKEGTRVHLAYDDSDNLAGYER